MIYSSLKTDHVGVILIGLGNIGLKYDYHASENYTLTHSKAIDQHPNLSMEAVVDSSSSQINLYTKKYGGRGFDSIEKALKYVNPSIAVVATPTSNHLSDIKKLSCCKSIKIILCEKPIAYNTTEAREILEICSSNQIKLFINYIRRVDPASIEVKKIIDERTVGEKFKGHCWYTKGVMNNGSHFLNLLEYWLGPTQKVVPITQERYWEMIDPEPTFNAFFKKGNVIFQPAWEECFSYYSIELVSDRGLINYKLGGSQVEINERIRDKNFPGYYTLKQVPTILKNEMDKYQYNIASALYNEFNGLKTTLCSGEDALRTLMALEIFNYEKTY